MQTDYFFQTALAVWAVAVGAVLCAVYDVFRVFRLRRAQNTFVLFICDFLFCMFATVCMLLLFFNLSYGKARAYAFVFAGMGFLVWRFTVSRLFTALVLKLIILAERLLNSIKMRVSAVVLRMMRRIYTKIYCRLLVHTSRNGFGLIKKRKESKNEQEAHPS